jgi:hypothetical protein
VLLPARRLTVAEEALVADEATRLVAFLAADAAARDIRVTYPPGN